MNNTTARTDIAADLRAVLRQLVAELRWDSDDMLRLIKREDLSMPRIAALHLVGRCRAASISEISGGLDLSLANTSMLVDKLVCHGFVTRVEDASDRRQKIIRLTAKGRALVDEIQATRVNTLVQRMLLLPPDLLDRAIEVLGEVTAQLPPVGANSGAAQPQQIEERL